MRSIHYSMKQQISNRLGVAHIRDTMMQFVTFNHSSAGDGIVSDRAVAVIFAAHVLPRGPGWRAL